MTTWIPVSKPSQSWTGESAPLIRVFSPYVFSLAPIFDTGTTQGLWISKPKLSGAWSVEAAP